MRIDVSRPLIRMVYLVFPDAEEPIGAAFRYERLANLCFTCGMMNHVEPRCLVCKMVLNKGRRCVGDWIRAEEN